MLAPVPVMLRKEVFPNSDWLVVIGSKPTPLFVAVDGGESFHQALPHGLIALEVNNEENELELTCGDEVIMPEKALIEQILLSSKTSIKDDLSPSEKLSPVASFGLYLGGLRRRKGFTIQRLSKETSISASQLARIELGNASLDDVTRSLDRMAIALGVDQQKLDRLLITLILE